MNNLKSSKRNLLSSYLRFPNTDIMFNQSYFALEEDEISKEPFFIARSALRKQNVQTKSVFLHVLIEGDLTEQGSVTIFDSFTQKWVLVSKCLCQLFKNVAYDTR